MSATRRPGLLRHLLAILVLPVNVVITVPVILLLMTHNLQVGCATTREGAIGSALMGGAVFAVGLALVALTVHAFARHGEGTLAPWDPTQKLVVAGIYRHTRNPMIAGVVLMLVGEAVIFCSPAVLALALGFLALNAAYFKLSEEPGLVQRFGKDYERYRENVPMWWPRMRPWVPHR